MYTPTHTTCCVCYINDFFPDFSHLIAIKCDAMRCDYKIILLTKFIPFPMATKTENSTVTNKYFVLWRNYCYSNETFYNFQVRWQSEQFLAEVKPSAQHMLLLNFRNWQSNSFTDIDLRRTKLAQLICCFCCYSIFYVRVCSFFLHTNNLPFFWLPRY